MSATSVMNPYRHPPFLCALCRRPIAARATHRILSPLSALTKPSQAQRDATSGAMVCGRCMDDKTAHGRLYTECDAPGYCDLWDHAVNSCSDRATARAVLAKTGRLAPDPSNTEPKRSTTS